MVVEGAVGAKASRSEVLALVRDTKYVDVSGVREYLA